MRLRGGRGWCGAAQGGGDERDSGVFGDSPLTEGDFSARQSPIYLDLQLPASSRLIDYGLWPMVMISKGYSSVGLRVAFRLGSL